MKEENLEIRLGMVQLYSNHNQLACVTILNTTTTGKEYDTINERSVYEYLVNVINDNKHRNISIKQLRKFDEHLFKGVDLLGYITRRLKNYNIPIPNTFHNVITSGDDIIIEKENNSDDIIIEKKQIKETMEKEHNLIKELFIEDKYNLLLDECILYTYITHGDDFINITDDIEKILIRWKRDYSVGRLDMYNEKTTFIKLK